MKRLLLFCAAVTVIVAGTLGCGGNSGSGSSGPTPLPTSSFRSGLAFIPFGDDFTVGIGSSSCGVNLTTTPCTSSSGSGGAPVSINPHGWTQLLAAYFGLPKYQPLSFYAAGVTGALTGGAPLPEASPGDIQKNPGQWGSLTSFTNVPRSANIKMLIGLEGGVNDVLDAFYSNLCTSTGGKLVGGGNATLTAPCTASNTSLADNTGNVRNGTLYVAVRSMLASLQSTAGGPPEATVVIGVPDLGQFPAFATWTAAQRSQLTADSQIANQALNLGLLDSGLQNGAFVDWFAFNAANPQYYGSLYFSSDGFHLSDSGYSVLESLVQGVVVQKFATLAVGVGARPGQ